MNTTTHFTFHRSFVLKGALLAGLVALAGCRPTIEFDASTESISANTPVTLTWDVEFARGSASRNIKISPTVGEVDEESGEWTLNDIDETTTFKLRAKANVLGFPVTAEERVTITVSEDLESFTFLANTEDWQAGFSGFESGLENEVDGTATFANPISIPGNTSVTSAYTLSAFNPGDNLFMFTTLKYPDNSGKIRANTTYKVGFEIAYALDAVKGCSTEANDPANIWLKAGAAIEEPAVETVNDIETLNLDKGNANVAGSELLLLGQASIDGTDDCDDPVLTRNVLSNMSNPQSVTTDGDGNLWLVVGFDTNYTDDTIEAHLIEVKVEIVEQ